MSRSFQVCVGDFGSFRARRGEVLLDAALINGVDLPHDCRSGTCGSCRCTVSSGAVEGGSTGAPGQVLACQAKVVSDVELLIEETPPVETFSGRVKAVRNLSADVAEVTIETRSPFDYLPGQYAQVAFAGFPARCYSPTVPLEGPIDRYGFRLQVKRVRKGRVSQALGTNILPGHKVKVVGPYGSAYLRPGQTNRLVLVASGAGFAPIWAIAHSALCEMPDREIVVVVGANRVTEFYMSPALWRLIAFPMTQVISSVRYADPTRALPLGVPVDFIPPLTSRDLVYACGAPNMVEAVAVMAGFAGASCYVDPFYPAASGGFDLWEPLARAAATPINLLRRFGGWEPVGSAIT